MPQGPLTTYNRTVEEREAAISIGVAWPKRGASSLFLSPLTLSCRSKRERERERNSKTRRVRRGEEWKRKREKRFRHASFVCLKRLTRDQLPFGVLFRPNGISFASRQCDDRSFPSESLKGTRSRDRGAGPGHSGNI